MTKNDKKSDKKIENDPKMTNTPNTVQRTKHPTTRTRTTHIPPLPNTPKKRGRERKRSNLQTQKLNGSSYP